MKAYPIKWTIVCLFLMINASISWSEEPSSNVSNKIGPLLYQKIAEQKKAPESHNDRQGLLSLDEQPSQELEKVIVVIDRDHLSELPQDVVDELKQRVEALGGHIGNHAFNNVQVWISVDRIEELAQWEEIRAIRFPTKPGTMGIQSEGVSIGNINTWHSSGIAGQGVNVGVVDGGFQGYDILKTVELPGNTITAYTGSPQAFYSDVHGTACAEIIYDIAPGAELFLVNATDMDVGFSVAVNWLKNQGVEIISSSIGRTNLIYCKFIYDILKYPYLTSAYFAPQIEYLNNLDDQINQIVTQTVNESITWVQAAGNYGQHRWKGFFNDPDNNNFHNFSSAENFNEINLPQFFQYGHEVYVVMSWGQQTDFITYDDYDLYITDEYANIVSFSEIRQNILPLGMEACKFIPIPGVKYFILVSRYWASPQELMLSVGIDQLAYLEYFSPEKTINMGTPFANSDAITVGAVPYFNPTVIEDFSGQGPGENGIIKPDLVAPDAVSTQSYGTAFYGTSAAAPHVAGVCALVKQMNPSWSPAQIKAYLEANAIDLGAPGKDNVYGAGLVNLPEIISFTNYLYFPHIASNANWETEICIINNSPEQGLSGVLKAYSNQGQAVSSMPVSLDTNARREIVIGDELPNPSGVGYVIFESDSDSTCGYTKFFIEGKYRAAIPAASDVNTGDIYISHIASGPEWWTGISIVNTTPAPKDLTIEFDNGTIQILTIAAGEHRVFSIKSLFGGAAQPNIRSAVIKNGSGIVGLELFGSSDTGGKNYLSGILLKDETTTDIYYPHVVSSSIWWTGVVAYNPSSTACNLIMTPFSNDGTALAPQTITLAGKEKYIGTASQLNFPEGTAWFQISASSPVTGFELFGTNNGNQLGGYTGVGISSTDGVFAKIEKDGWTGIAFVNIEDSPAVVTMTAYNDSGNAVAAETINLNAHQKVLGIASNLFSRDISAATYIRYSSNREIVGFQLNGSTDGMLLDGLPGI